MKILGTNIVIATSDNTFATAIAAAKSCTIDVKADITEVASPTTGAWKTYITKRKEWDVSIGNLVMAESYQNRLLYVGETVTLGIDVAQPGDTHTFAGFYAGSVTDYYTTNPSGIYFHPTLNQFVALGTDEVYYTSWIYEEDDTTTEAESYFTTPESNATYVDSSTLYRYMYAGDEGLLRMYRYYGTAIVVQADISARRGSLASGTFRFKGSGELALYSY